MKDTLRGGNTAIVVTPENYRRLKRRTNEHCSICAHRTWFDAVPLMEPETVTAPRLSWILCQQCYPALLAEMRRSPIRTPLKLRIAMGVVASERWNKAYPSAWRARALDRKLLLFIAWGFVAAMVVHLSLIVFLAFIIR